MRSDQGFHGGMDPRDTLRPRHGPIKKERTPSLDFDRYSSSPESKPHSLRSGMPETGDMIVSGQSPKKSRAKESSKHFGVRFRPDLNKWVAEIRVAEWRTVDKKVWLGTFDSEEGAARAVDAARKLLQCKKKRLPNFPCPELDSYSDTIPPSLNLLDLRDDSMFKDVTQFVKRKAQEYAASFSPKLSPITASLHINDMTSQTNSPTSSVIYGFGGYAGSELPSCDGIIVGGHDHSFRSFGTPSVSDLSSAGTSPVDEKWSQQYVHFNEEHFGFGDDGVELVEQQSVAGACGYGDVVSILELPYCVGCQSRVGFGGVEYCTCEDDRTTSFDGSFEQDEIFMMEMLNDADYGLVSWGNFQEQATGGSGGMISHGNDDLGYDHLCLPSGMTSLQNLSTFTAVESNMEWPISQTLQQNCPHAPLVSSPFEFKSPVVSC